MQSANVVAEQLIDKFRLILSDQNTIVILDDAQCIYNVTKIWDHFKARTSQPLICFSSYSLQDGVLGEISTPIMLTRKIPIYSLLLFSRNEVRRFAQNFINSSTSCEPIFSESVQDEIYDITSGYPGLVFYAFHILTTQNSKYGLLIPLKLKPDFFAELTSTWSVRCFRSLEKMINFISAAIHTNEDQAPMVRELILRCLYEMIIQETPLYTDFINSISGDKQLAE